MENIWPRGATWDRSTNLYHGSTCLNNSNVGVRARYVLNIDYRVKRLGLTSASSQISVRSAGPFGVNEADRAMVSWKTGALLFRNPMAQQAPRTLQLEICLISQHPLVLETLQRLFTKPGFHVQSQQLGGLLAAKDLQQIPVSPAKVYVLDAHAPRPITEAMAAAIHMRYPESYLILVAEKFDEGDAFALLRLGAKGLLRYADVGAQLVRVLETVAAGGFWVPRTLLSSFIDSVNRSGFKGKGPTGSAKLSPRETQVLDDLLENRSNKQIAAKLRISERTVKFHVANVLEKFAVGRRADLVLLWYQQHHR